MSKIKNIALVCILSITAFIFAGCTNATSTSIYFADGSRTSEITVEIDPTLCAEYGINKETALSTLLYIGNQQLSYLNANAGVTAGAHLTHGIDTTNPNLYAFTLSFDSFEDYCIFYKITEEELNTPATINEGLFTSQYVIQETTLIKENKEINTGALGVYFTQADLITIFANNLFAGDKITCQQFLDKVSLNIFKCFPSEYGYSSNADYRQRAVLPSGLNASADEKTAYTAHIWTGTLLSPPENIFVYKNFTTNANRAAWYILAIILTLIFGTIVFLCLYLNHKKQAKLGQHNNIQTTPNQDNGNTSQPIILTTASSFPQGKDKGEIVNKTPIIIPPQQGQSPAKPVIVIPPENTEKED